MKALQTFYNIKKIKDNMNIEKNKYPIFWKLLKENINKENINDIFNAPTV